MCVAVFPWALRPIAPANFSTSRFTAAPSLSWCPRLQHAGYWKSSTVHRRSKFPTAAMWTENSVLLQDVFSATLTSGVALGLLFFWGETAKKRIFEQKTTRKLVHISVGLVFMLCWPLFSPGCLAPFLAALAPGINIIRMLLLGVGIWKNEAVIKSMSRHGDHRELLKGPLYYACTITFSTLFFWRTSPIAIAAICNLCAGDGVADLVGRRFGKKKLPYNPDKSYAGTAAMAVAGILTSFGSLRLRLWQREHRARLLHR